MRYRHLSSLWRCSFASTRPRKREAVATGLSIVAGVLLLALTGCGRRNAPEPPPDVPNTYPRPYPSE
jgi:hypothetical protein